MTDLLCQPRQLAESVRFSGDSRSEITPGDSEAYDSLRLMYSQNGLLISSAVTPGLANVLEKTCERLSVPASATEAYVYSSAEPQATCFGGDESRCIITVSSGMVDLLTHEELQFVIGHELGHFLLSHSSAHEESLDLVELMRQRAMEISADRIGFLACQSINTAARAMMKTISGLSDTHLRFDVVEFISQLNEPNDDRLRTFQNSTHPSFVVRCRTLLLFSACDILGNDEPDHIRNQLARIDTQIEKHLSSFVDGPVRSKVELAKRNVALWLTASCAVQDGIFDRDEQELIRRRFGDDVLDKLVKIFRELGREGINTFVERKLRESRHELEELFPSNHHIEFDNIAQSVKTDFM